MKTKKFGSLYIITAILLFFNAIMLIFPKEIFAGAKNGLTLWFEKAVPTLLPFMITTNCLVYLDFPRILGRAIQPLTLTLFAMDGTEAFPFLTGLTAGYPMGIKTTAQLYKNGSIDKRAAQRLMLFCNNPGALFAAGTVGTGFFGDPKAGYLLVSSCYFSAVLLALATGIFFRRKTAISAHAAPIRHEKAVLGRAVSDATASVLAIGAYMIVFSAICAVFERLHIFDGLAYFGAALGLSPKQSKALAMGTLEMTNGCALAAGKGKACVCTAAAILGWGGLSVHAQSLEFIGDTDLKAGYYYAGKLLSCILSAFTAWILYDIVF